MIRHRITWWVYAVGNRGTPAAFVEKLRHTAQMRGSWDGWDASCSCGWESGTGGAIKARITEAITNHKWDVEHGFWHPATGEN